VPIDREFDRLCVVLVSARNPLNIGAAARAMCNFGFQRLRVVNPYDAAFREARSAVGAAALLTNAEEFKTVAEAVEDCTLVVGTIAIGRRHLQHSLKNLADGVPFILEELRRVQNETPRVAILFGSEKFGLSNEDLSHCHWLMHIPTGEEQPSMNLGQAVAVCLYELARDNVETKVKEKPALASAGDMERMTNVLLDTLHASGYMNTRPADDKAETVRRLIRRLSLSAEDATVWLGMLRQILWRLKTKD
jgi:tRNA/rRNA methyltransferase